MTTPNLVTTPESAVTPATASVASASHSEPDTLAYLEPFSRQMFAVA